jgi:transposase
MIVDQELAQMDLLTEQLAVIDEHLELAMKASSFYALLRTIPGVGPRLGAAIALEFGDVRRFKSARAAACYTGLIPSTYQSGEKCLGGRITKQGNSTLRWALVQAALLLCRLDDGAKRQYTRLRNRLKRPKARVAMARHLAVAIWHMAKTGEVYRACKSPPTSTTTRKAKGTKKRAISAASAS